MPQFDFFSFISQTFWILFGLFFFYFFILYFFVPKYSEILKLREKFKIISKDNYKSIKNLHDLHIKNFFNRFK